MDAPAGFLPQLRLAPTIGLVLTIGLIATGCGSGSNTANGQNALPKNLASASASATPTAPTLQSCKGRLGAGTVGPPNSVPRLPGTFFDAGAPQKGLYGARVPGTDHHAAAVALSARFTTAKLDPSTVVDSGTASHFTFRGKFGGSVYVGVLCQDHLRVLYDFTSGKAIGNAVTPSASPTAPGKKNKK